MRPGDTISVNDRMQQGYSYVLEAPAGRIDDAAFTPHFTPEQMLEMGIFEGRYINDCRGEFPGIWYERAKIAAKPDPALNFFGVKSRQPLSEWRRKGWILGPDPRGWFQWYCRYYLGRRLPEVDRRQIGRWRAFRRHAAQVKANCDQNDLSCRPRQRQALLQWSYDCMI
ncbi:hypothetical protein [Paracoccus pacificus]|uniref:Uncharacterized protein n=1 Tax=Paracoccus pacificus TaxID=1463598 RepID=A0ABW4R859_9RHOB